MSDAHCFRSADAAKTRVSLTGQIQHVFARDEFEGKTTSKLCSNFISQFARPTPAQVRGDVDLKGRWRASGPPPGNFAPADPIKSPRTHLVASFVCFITRVHQRGAELTHSLTHSLTGNHLTRTTKTGKISRRRQHGQKASLQSHTNQCSLLTVSLNPTNIPQNWQSCDFFCGFCWETAHWWNHRFEEMKHVTWRNLVFTKTTSNPVLRKSVPSFIYFLLWCPRTPWTARPNKEKTSGFQLINWNLAGMMCLIPHLNCRLRARNSPAWCHDSFGYKSRFVRSSWGISVQGNISIYFPGPPTLWPVGVLTKTHRGELGGHQSETRAQHATHRVVGSLNYDQKLSSFRLLQRISCSRSQLRDQLMSILWLLIPTLLHPDLAWWLTDGLSEYYHFCPINAFINSSFINISFESRQKHTLPMQLRQSSLQALKYNLQTVHPTWPLQLNHIRKLSAQEGHHVCAQNWFFMTTATFCTFSDVRTKDAVNTFLSARRNRVTKCKREFPLAEFTRAYSWPQLIQQIS